MFPTLTDPNSQRLTSRVIAREQRTTRYADERRNLADGYNQGNKDDESGSRNILQPDWQRYDEACAHEEVKEEHVEQDWKKGQGC